MPEQQTSSLIRRHEGKPCPYCSHPMVTALGRAPTRDHIFPKCRGYNLGGNRAIVCKPCNTAKKHWDILEWLARLRKGNDRRATHVARFAAFIGIKAPPPEPVRTPLRTMAAETRRIVDNYLRARERADAAAIPAD